MVHGFRSRTRYHARGAGLAFAPAWGETRRSCIALSHLNGLLATEGGFEYPLTLLAVALFFVVRGGGPFSVDALVGRLRSGREPKQDAEREHRRAPIGAEPVRQAD